MLVKISVFMILDDFKESGVNSKAPSIAIMFPFAVYFLKTENNRKKIPKNKSKYFAFLKVKSVLIPLSPLLFTFSPSSLLSQTFFSTFSNLNF